MSNTNSSKSLRSLLKAHEWFLTFYISIQYKLYAQKISIKPYLGSRKMNKLKFKPCGSPQLSF